MICAAITVRINNYEVIIMSVEDILKIVKEKEVKFIDYRFTNTNGKEQHVTVTASEDGIKTDMFRTMYKVLAEWHNSVFIYLCMEKPEIWDQAFGWRFASNAEFEESFARKTLYRNN